MLKHLNERRQDEQGFTLIELMVVVLIMGILMAIAIPTFLSTQGSANDSSAKSNATNVLTSEKAYFEDNQTFLDAGTINGAALDPNMPWTANASAPAVANSVVASVATLAGTTLTYVPATVAAPNSTGPIMVIMDLSKSKNCFYIYDNEASATAPVLAYAESSGGCFQPTLLLPTATPAASGGNAGAHIVAGAAPTTAAMWYASW